MHIGAYPLAWGGGGGGGHPAPREHPAHRGAKPAGWCVVGGWVDGQLGGWVGRWLGVCYKCPILYNTTKCNTILQNKTKYKNTTQIAQNKNKIQQITQTKHQNNTNIPPNTTNNYQNKRGYSIIPQDTTQY